MNWRVLWKARLGALLLAPAVLHAQDRRITGTVTRSGTNTPLADVEISVLGQTQSPAARTNAEGHYTITAPDGAVTLQARGIGYRRVALPVPANQATVDFTLVQDVFKLDEVVVSGQATTVERRSATTSVALVTAEELADVPAPTIESSLAGRVTGVNVQSNSGAPGGGIQVQVRGNSTILGGFDPLYVVDGIIYSNASISSGRGFATDASNPNTEGDAVNRVADLNPADIATIEVLKGAAASSIYGSKASNGVVVITTTRGRVGTPRVTLTQRAGVSSPIRLMESRHWNVDDAVEAFGEEARPFFANNSSPFFDNAAAVYDNRKPSYETSANINGGSQTTRYFASGTLARDEGIARKTGFSRQSLRLNLDQSLSPTVGLKISSAFNHAEHDRGFENNCNNFGCQGYALAYIPSFVDITRRNADGSFPEPTLGPQANPIQLSELGVNHEETNRFTGGLTMDWNPPATGRNTFRFVAALGLDGFDQQDGVWTPNELFFEQPQPLPGEAVQNAGRSVFLNYNLNGIHTFTTGAFAATTAAGLQYEDRRLHTSLIDAENLLPGQRNVNQGTNITVRENLTHERTIALYLQEDVRLFSDALLVRGGLRAERSSVNGDIDKYYVFPQVSSSYRFPNLLGSGSELKLRAAYGETGNQPLFGQKFTNLATPQLGGSQGITVATASGSPNVAPERLKGFEGGLDGTLANERVTFEVTGFTHSTTNLLLQRVPSPSSGFTSQIFNGGKIENQGIEAGIGVTPIRSSAATWVSRATFTKYTSEVKDLAGLPSFFPPSAGFGGLGQTRVEVGKPLTQIVGFDFDENGERAATLTQLGNSAPDFRMGFANNVTFGRFSVNSLLDWQHGGDIINLTRFLQDDGQTSPDWGTPEFEDRYKGYSNGVIAPYIEDASFLKLREVSVSYDVPTRLARTIHGVNSLRLSVTGRNLFMWAPYSGLDPEVANFGAAAIRNNLDISPYPPSRSVFFNFNVGF